MAGIGTRPSTATRPESHGSTKPTVVLVHGAWADVSGWNEIHRRGRHRREVPGLEKTGASSPTLALAGGSVLAVTCPFRPSDVRLS